MASVIVWFRRDLRLSDNPALVRAVAARAPLIPLYIHAPDEEAPWVPGAASHWWLHHSLCAVDTQLRAAGSALVVQRGSTLAVLKRIIEATGAGAVYWNRLYDPATIARDTALKQALTGCGVEVVSFAASLSVEPWEISNATGKPYRVFTPFYRAWSALADSVAPVPAPRRLPPLPEGVEGLAVDALGLLPTVSWDGGLRDQWTPGALGAARQFEATVAEGVIERYENERDRPDRVGTSRLSPHLHFGEIGPREVLARLQEAGAVDGGAASAPYRRQLAWREFAHHVLFHFPATAEQPMDPRFEAFPWLDDSDALTAWQRGRTGIPLVDAGMRELWHTGWMHNRVRMVVASFLTKNLQVGWIHGARWFWDTLVDANLANNTMGWQWTAGCGVDAAPFFRVFNPVRQGQRFDPQGDYIRRWVPEVARLPAKYIHAPFDAPSAVLSAAARLGDDYPLPIVDLASSRDQALANWQAVRAARAD